jgi:hemoglobin-like flavoprotein
MTISQSIEELLRHKQIIIELFYERLLTQHADFRPFFKGVNLQHQATLLTMALIVVESHYTHAYPATAHYLHVLGHRHHQNGIPPELFPKFRDCLLEILAEFHAENWTSELATGWREAIDRAAATMLEGYRQAYTY